MKGSAHRSHSAALAVLAFLLVTFAVASPAYGRA
jgi:hypothetical protein